MKKEIVIEGMTCANCALGVKKRLEKKGAHEVYVDFISGKAVFQDNFKSIDEYVAAVEEIGYSAHSLEGNEKAHAGHQQHNHSRYILYYLVISAVLTLPVFLSMFFPHSIISEPMVQFALTLPVWIIGVLEFGRNGFRSLSSGIMNMDLLIIIGATAAFGYSIYGFVNGLGHDFMFFETTATIITLVLLGRYIEDRAVQKTSSLTMNQLLLEPDFAQVEHMVDGKHKLTSMATSALAIDNVVVLSLGERIPTDGALVAGSLEVDNSHITGESLPVVIQNGDTLYSGALVVQGNGKMRVTKIKSNSTISEMRNLIEDARQNQPKIQQLADTISQYFIPVVLIISLLTFLVSYFVIGISSGESLIRAIAVLVISCPCALGLATPLAVVVGLGKMAKNGIVVKSGLALEVLSEIQQVVFDKTGTLTENDLEIDSVTIFNATYNDQIGDIVIGMEQYSSHPIAKALIKHFGNATAMELSEVQEIPGKGIEAISSDGLIRYRLKGKENHNGIVSLSVNEVEIAEFKLTGVSRENNAAVIKALKQQGKKLHIVSGDQEGNVKELANTLGIDHYSFNTKPKEKLSYITNLQKNNSVAMVGDGVNDAPALQQADIGISLSGASDLSSSIAEVVLLGDDLQQLPKAFSIGKQIKRVIQQNLFWAFMYNVIAIPLAAAGYLHPMLAALSMAFSDLIVVGNSLRFYWKK